MKTIQIAPYKKDCKVEGNKVTGTMHNKRYTFIVPEKYHIPTELQDTMIKNFCEAIALCSKTWQVEELLNKHWNIEGGKMEIQEI